MKARTVDHVTSNEELVRLRIYDGELSADEGTAAMLRMEQNRVEWLQREARAHVAMIDALASCVPDFRSLLVSVFAERWIAPRDVKFMNGWAVCEFRFGDRSFSISFDLMDYCTVMDASFNPQPAELSQITEALHKLADSFRTTGPVPVYS